MLNKIKDKILHVLRKYCGYYELKKSLNQKLNDKQNFIGVQGNTVQGLVLQNDKLNINYDKLSAQHEAKILEYDILDNKYKEVVNLTTNYTLSGDIYNLGNFSSAWSSENRYKYNSYLIAELEEILNIMKQKGVHPQDLIKRIINKANRDIKE